MAFLAIISGPLGSGKTGICRRLYQRLREAGYPASGIVEETSRNERGIPVGIGFRHLSTGEGWAWTERNSREDPPPAFDFPEAPLARAVEHLSQDAGAGLRPLILDEVGLLEIRDGKGFGGWLSGYLRRKDAFLIVSVRTGREDAFLEFLGSLGVPQKTLVIGTARLTGESRETCLDSAYNWVLRHCPKEAGKLYFNQNTIPKR